MPEPSRNMPEQEHSIKARSHELFVEEAPVLPAGATKPFEVYLRETPARPISAGIRALFWVMGIIVGVLFLVAIWRVSHRHGGRAPADAASAKTAMFPSTAGRGPGADSGEWAELLTHVPGSRMTSDAGEVRGPRS